MMLPSQAGQLLMMRHLDLPRCRAQKPLFPRRFRLRDHLLCLPRVLRRFLSLRLSQFQDPRSRRVWQTMHTFKM